MPNTAENRPFSQMFKEGAGRVLSGLENFSRKFVSLVMRDPVSSACLGAASVLAVYAFGFSGEAEAMRTLVLPRIVKGAAIGVAVAIPLATWATYSFRPSESK